ncbi:hypothetical protein GCM10029978_075350 [Actinoallomurus acanthiterrae]
MIGFCGFSAPPSSNSNTPSLNISDQTASPRRSGSELRTELGIAPEVDVLRDEVGHPVADDEGRTESAWSGRSAGVRIDGRFGMAELEQQFRGRPARRRCR